MEQQKIQELLMDTFYDICVDDGGRHTVAIQDAWMEERFIEAGLLFASDELANMPYPKMIHEHMVNSKQEALNMDTIATSYSATLKYKNGAQDDFTRSTADSLYVPDKKGTGKKHVYLIEFKNGDWESDELYRKITDSIMLLNDLETLDHHVIIKDNRSKESIKVDDLEFSEFYNLYTGYDGSKNFYKENVSFVLVSGAGENCFRKYAELCNKRDSYAEMDRILKKFDFNILKKANPSLYNFGYESINKLAFLIIKANSTNKYMMHYDNIMKLFSNLDKIKKNQGKSKGVTKLLKSNKELQEYLASILYNDDERYKTIKNFFLEEGYSEVQVLLGIAAVYSVQPVKGHYVSDDFEILCDLAKSIMKPKKEKYFEIIESFFQNTKESVFRGNVSLIEEMQTDEFLNLESLLGNKNYEEVIKRALLIQRVQMAQGIGELKGCKDCVEQLFRNIFPMNETIGNLQEWETFCTGYSEGLYILAAIISYMQGELGLRDVTNDLHNSYSHVIRQLEYLRDIQRRGRGQQFGRFATPLFEYIDDLKKRDEAYSLDEILEKMLGKIAEGKSIQDIFPIKYAQYMTIDVRMRKLHRLSTKVKGTILYDVKGWNAIDFVW